MDESIFNNGRKLASYALNDKKSKVTFAFFTFLLFIHPNRSNIYISSKTDICICYPYQGQQTQQREVIELFVLFFCYVNQVPYPWGS